MASSTMPVLRRALLYVPASSPKFLAKSLTLTSDNVTYDLEDSVTPSMKSTARTALQTHLRSLSSKQATSIGEIAVRINAVSTPHAIADIRAVASLPNLDAIVVPKVSGAADLALVEDNRPIAILALIESAKAVVDLREICTATPNLRGLIFAAEDFALDLSLRRTPHMHEMAYARSAIVTAARAFGLESAIDAVCTSLRGPGAQEQLAFECENGRGFGFTGKQCIHPDQVPYVQRMFSPDAEQVEWAARVVIADEKASAAGKGAFSLAGKMIDAPVVGKARATLAEAKQCGIDVDALRDKFKDESPE
ncbi:beta subunit of citrate lyase [Thermothelomyces heterothallicus CBS 203.75]